MNTELHLELSSLSYKSKPNVLKDTYVEYFSTDTAVICGPVASGKSSLQYSLAGVIPNVESFRKVKLDGQLIYGEGQNQYIISAKNYRWLFSKISVLFQYPEAV